MGGAIFIVCLGQRGAEGPTPGGYALMDLSEPNAPVLFSDVDEMISAHNSRGLAVQKGPVGLGGSNKRQKRGQINRS